MNNSNVSKNSTESPEARESVIGIRVQMLAAAMSKKCPEELVDVFKKHLVRFPISVLSKAFTRAEAELERFPTPRIMSTMCGEAMPSTAWRYNFEPGHDRRNVECLIDPDPMCDLCRRLKSEHPNEICANFIDEREARFMYRPQNCFEGRGFLHRLEQLATGDVKSEKSA